MISSKAGYNYPVNKPRSILVVDDDKKIVTLVSLYLKNDGYQVICAYDGRQALDLALTTEPDLIVLDLMLPGLDGTEVCRTLRARLIKVPIIMLTARSTEDDKLRGLDIGADDYITKPFSPRELVARVRAVLRRLDHLEPPQAEVLTFAHLKIYLSRREVWVNNRLVNLTPTEYRLLELMAHEPGKVFSRADLIERVFGLDYQGLDRTVDVHVMNLRRKMEQNHPARRFIVTVPGHGYRFEGEAEHEVPNENHPIS